jgi:CheY-like chemotaxis protein
MILCHVLIIEDEAMIALDLENLLECEGATSFSFAASEGEAVAAARSRRPDVITSDVTLLEGTGPKAVARIRATMGDIPVVYISGTLAGCGAGQPMTKGLHKPLNRAAVASAFRELRQIDRA